MITRRPAKKPYTWSEEGWAKHQAAQKKPHPLSGELCDLWLSGLSYAKVGKLYGMTRSKAGGLIWREWCRRQGLRYESYRKYHGEARKQQVEKTISLPVVRALRDC